MRLEWLKELISVVEALTVSEFLSTYLMNHEYRGLITEPVDYTEVQEGLQKGGGSTVDSSEIEKLHVNKQTEREREREREGERRRGGEREREEERERRREGERREREKKRHV